MHVRFVLPGFPKDPSGGHLMVYTYANHLVRQGHRVTVEHVPTVPATGMSRVKYRLARTLRPRWADLDKRVDVRNYSAQVFAEANRADLHVATSVGTARFAAARAARNESAGLYFIQGLETFNSPEREVHDTWKLPMSRVVVSPWLQSSLRALGLEADVVLNPVDDVFLTVPPRPKRFDVLTSLSPHPWKRSDLALAVLKALRRRNPDLRLGVFGVAPRDVKLPDDIEYVQGPSRLQLAELYASSRVFFMVSETEGFGLPAAEAMASGAAVVTTQNGGVPSWADGHAHIADADDAPSLATLVHRVLGQLDDSAVEASKERDFVRSFSERAAGDFEAALLRAVERQA